MSIVTIHVEHALTGRSAGVASGGEHWVVEQELHVGRLHRKAGDALCKPSRQFWGLDDWRPYPRGADCTRCVEIAARLGDLLKVAA